MGKRDRGDHLKRGEGGGTGGRAEERNRGTIRKNLSQQGEYKIERKKSLRGSLEGTKKGNPLLHQSYHGLGEGS